MFTKKLDFAIIIIISLLAVHGFDSLLYEVEEGMRLDTKLTLNVKGTSRVYTNGFSFEGTISSIAAGTAGQSDSFSNPEPLFLKHTSCTSPTILSLQSHAQSIPHTLMQKVSCFLSLNADSSDFEVLPPRQMSGGEVQFFTRNDEITLEYDDRVLLVYTPEITDLAQQLEQLVPPEFLRDTATVQIDDNDREKIYVILCNHQILSAN